MTTRNSRLDGPLPSVMDLPSHKSVYCGFL